MPKRGWAETRKESKAEPGENILRIFGVTVKGVFLAEVRVFGYEA